ncbi:hypothetical protein KSS87_000222 [Heliosperma pusillum]|nr:hypothetical protein KSS87_000222 [Heliosperma pusillum]
MAESILFNIVERVLESLGQHAPQGVVSSWGRRDLDKLEGAIRDAQLSKAKLIDFNNSMPVLKLSYDYLPSTLKRCFAYCSLLPNDYESENFELLRLWMAQGYIELFEESLGMEGVGDQYFFELLRRNVFQDVKEYDIVEVIRCRMHDLEKSQANPHDPCCSKGIIQQHQLLRFRSLRALECSNIETVPDSVRRFTHLSLRYLKFSHSSIKFLPDGITRLDNLKTLNVDYCRKLKELPRGFTKLVNLRHLGIRECHITDLTLNFGRLKPLRELNRFIIGQNNGVDTLSDLNLRGRLGIECRIWRTNAVIELRLPL